jgi:hypothetical protein
MTIRHQHTASKCSALAIFLFSVGSLALPVHGQDTAPRESTPPTIDSQGAARRQILESDRWKNAGAKLNEWLSVQQVYTPDEVAAINAELAARIAKMPPHELEKLLGEMEEKLAVLSSPEAADARVWLSQFLATARNPEQLLGRSRPDLINMSAAEIRKEIQWLQQHRGSRQQVQTAFEQGRALQVQSAQQAQAARQQAQISPSRAATNNVGARSPYAPLTGRREVPLERPVIYDVGPWGLPVLWHPLNNFW